MAKNIINFNKPYATGRELEYIKEVFEESHLAGDGLFSERCSNWLENFTGSRKVLLTHSCTAALEMTALLMGLQPGDEVIMPSYTFVSTANAFALRGAVPVFVDIDPNTLNINETLIASAITTKTKAIVVVHYAGVACEMDTIMKIAEEYSLFVVEDAAQAIASEYKGRKLGSIGDFGCFSFHETKNIQCGEGGALLINNEAYIEHAEIIREKGTDRSKFHRGQVDKYTWVGLGSSFLPSEITAASLFAQLESTKEITKKRIDLWENYHKVFNNLPNVKSPNIPTNITHNAHLYYLILNDPDHREKFLRYMNNKGIKAVFHYVPLHNSPMGSSLGRTDQNFLEHTEFIAPRLVRLPLWIGLDEQQDYVIQSSLAALKT